jgi:hypothetical protein
MAQSLRIDRVHRSSCGSDSSVSRRFVASLKRTEFGSLPSVHSLSRQIRSCHGYPYPLPNHGVRAYECSEQAWQQTCVMIVTTRRKEKASGGGYASHQVPNHSKHHLPNFGASTKNCSESLPRTRKVEYRLRRNEYRLLSRASRHFASVIVTG